MPSDVSLPFAPAEYRQRLAKTRSAMDAAGIEVLFVADPSNMCWLTGFDAWSFYTHQGVIVALADDPVYWGRAQDTHAAEQCGQGETRDDAPPREARVGPERGALAHHDRQHERGGDRADREDRDEAPVVKEEQHRRGRPGPCWVVRLVLRHGWGSRRARHSTELTGFRVVGRP